MKLICLTLLFLAASLQNVRGRLVVEVVRGEKRQLAERDLRSEDLSKRKAVTDEDLWPGGVVPYAFTEAVGTFDTCVNTKTDCETRALNGNCEFNPVYMQNFCRLSCNFCGRSLGDRIRDAMDEWEKYTCLYFRPLEASDTDYILFKTIGSGCYADSIGVKGHEDQQEINIQGNVEGSGCDFLHIILHEIGHGIGLYHEQSRTDRDYHVSINWTNIEPGKEHNFDKAPAGEIDMRDVPYDYYSIMHYGQYDFAVNDSYPTIVTLDEFYQDIIGTVKRLSMLDIELVNKAYNCPTKYFRIRNQANLDVLEAFSNKVNRAAENGTDERQYWYMDGKYIRNKAVPDRVLTTNKNGAAQGEGRLRLKEPTGADNQLWEVTEDFTYYGFQSDFERKGLMLGTKLKDNGVDVSEAVYALEPIRFEDLQNWDFEKIP